MKFKLHKVALALPLAVATYSYAAQKSVDDGFSVVAPAHQQEINLKQLNAEDKQTAKNRYFVLLKDAPLALYNGERSGYKATSITATNGNNKTDKGLLDVKSQVSQNYLGLLAEQQRHAKMDIARVVQHSVEVKEAFKLALNALVVELTEGEARAVAKLPGVLAVDKEERHQLQTDRGPVHIGAPAIWGENDTGYKGEGLIVGIMDTGIASLLRNRYNGDYTEADFHPSFADKVIGADGETIEYDHTNPNGSGIYFGDCVDNPSWCNDKVIGIVSYSEITSLYPGNYITRYGNGKDTQGHGTHVASTVAGNPVYNVSVVNAIGEQSEFTFDHVTGVAPQANIISYQTCHPTQGCLPSLAVKAVEHAMSNGVTTMNYSVGGTASSPWFRADTLTMLSAREAGIHIAVSAGNNGRSGPMTVKSPANSPWVTTVAAYTHDRGFNDKTATFAGGEFALSSMTGKGASSGIESLELVYAGDVDSKYIRDLHGVGVCGSVNYDQYDNVAGKVLVCNRGGVDAEGVPLARAYKSKIAKKFGAAGMILINAEHTPSTLNADYHSVPSIHLSQEDGEALLAWMASGEGHTVSFTGSTVISEPDAADIAADFTSRGPEVFIKDYLVPDIAAPGVDIYAGGIGHFMHYPELPKSSKVNGNFRFMSGTSMSAPHVTGALTLMAGHEKSKSWTPSEVQSALMLTAHTKTYTDDDYDGVKTASTHFDAGSGSMRVNLAVEAGLVMPETEAGYLAANPYAKEYGLVDEIEGWHGEPHQMNLPSLTKSQCLIDCSWNRNFRATKAGTYNVTFEHYNQGFEISAAQSSFTVSQDEIIDLEFMVSANQALADEWVFGRVILTPTDNTQPTLTLPVTVNFIAGFAPEYYKVTAKRDNDSVAIDGVVTIGTDDLQVTKSGLEQATVVEFELERDLTYGTVIDGSKLDGAVYTIPLNIQSRSKRLVVEILESSSPDLDIYIGRDPNLDGKPDVYELASEIKWYSTGPDAFELIDIMAPENATYWMLVHNFTAATDVENPEKDKIKLAYVVVDYDDDTMTVEAPKSLAPRKEADLRIKWNKPMAEGSLHYATIELGTSAELSKNIGAIRVNVNRGGDDVQISTANVDQAAGTIDFDIALASNETTETRDYNFSVELASGVLVSSLTKEVVAGVTAMTAADQVDYVLDGDLLKWNHSQTAGATHVAFKLVVDTNKVQGLVDVTPVISAGVNTSEEASLSVPAEQVFIEGRPIFSAAASVSEIKEGQQFTLTATVIDAVIDNPTLSYSWTQVSGPAANISATAAEITVTAPKVDSDTTMVFQLIGNNGSKDSVAVTTSVNIENSSSSGSFGFILLGLVGLAGLARRRS